MKVSAIIAAAGSGTRLGAKMPKQFLELGDKPMLAWSIEAFCSSYLITDITVVTHPGFMELAKDIAEGAACSKEIQVVEGGATRQESVFRGITAFEENGASWVAVHDAARPFITPEHIENICLLAAEAGAAIPGIPVPDTVKKVDGDGFIIDTLDRSELVLAQTPQVCRRKDIMAAYQRAEKMNLTFTDESSLLESAGFHVAVAKGTMHNFKVTTESDLRVARMLAKNFV